MSLLSNLSLQAKIRAYTKLIAIIFVILNSSSNAEENDNYQLGIYPHYSDSHIEEAYIPIATQLSKPINKSINFDLEDNMENFFSNLMQQKYDIVLVQPFDYIDIADKFGYTPLATQTKDLQTIIVVREHSPLRTFHNLLGRDLHLPPRRTAVSYMAKHKLLNSELDPDKDINIIYESTHISCLLKTIIRVADACATAPEAVELFESKVFVKFKTLHKLPKIPHALFAIHPRVNKKDKFLLIKEMTSWKDNAPGLALLKKARMHGLKSINNKDYDIVRKIKQEVDQQSL